MSDEEGRYCPTCEIWHEPHKCIQVLRDRLREVEGALKEIAELRVTTRSWADADAFIRGISKTARAALSPPEEREHPIDFDRGVEALRRARAVEEPPEER